MPVYIARCFGTNHYQIEKVIILLNCMMMMIAPNSFVRRKEGAEGGGEGIGGDQRQGGQTGTLTSSADALGDRNIPPEGFTPVVSPPEYFPHEKYA